MPLEYGDEIWRQKTRIMGLLCGEEIMIVSRNMAQSKSVTDVRTDRFTMTKTALYIALHGKNILYEGLNDLKWSKQSRQ